MSYIISDDSILFNKSLLYIAPRKKLSCTFHTSIIEFLVYNHIKIIVELISDSPLPF